MKELSDKFSPTDYLFGDDLTEKIKSIRSLENVGKVLETPGNQSDPRGQKGTRGKSTQNQTKNFVRPARRMGKTGPLKGYSPKNQWDRHRNSDKHRSYNQAYNRKGRGYKIPFTNLPFQNEKPTPKTFCSLEFDQVKQEIKKLEEKGAIERCGPSQHQFISRIFLTDKANGKKRFILNLKNLNAFVLAPHFKMEDTRTAARLIQKNMFAASVDLKDAYYLIPIHKTHRKFLRFEFDNKLYQFCCLPFGLASAPYTFTKLLRPAVERLRSNGVICVSYLDDLLLLGVSKVECHSNIQKTITLLEYLGFIINKEKSCVIPSTRGKYLGFIFDSKSLTLELPNDKKDRILKWTNTLMSTGHCKILKFAQFLGILTAACPAVKYGWLHTELFERQKFLALRHNGGDYNARLEITNDMIDDMRWWHQTICSANNHLKVDSFQLEIFTDSSLSGWGAVCKGEKTHGWWASSDRNSHINILELKAIYLGLKCFTRFLKNCHILIRCDNTTAVACVNRMGSIQHNILNNMTRKIWEFCEQRNNYIFASYIQSSENIEADAESRVLRSDTEWSLENHIFQVITESFGVPDIDMFASALNFKCKRYVSWFRDPMAEAVDAFTLNWGKLSFYAFPPFALVLRMLQKIVTDQATGIVVVPFWQSQPWYPLFEKLTQRTTPTTPEPYPGSHCVIRQAFRLKGLPEEVLETMVNSLAPATIMQYNVTFKLWWQFCQKSQISPFLGNISDVLRFLQSLLNSTGNIYGTFNSHRSALSLILSRDLGVDNSIKRFMKGIFRTRPPKPKYKFIWDPQQVLYFLEKVVTTGDSSLKMLSSKLVTLMALSTGQRIQTLALIKCSEIRIGDNGVKIFIDELTKTSGPNRNQPCLDFPYFAEKPELCVASLIKQYLEVTNSIRDPTCDRFFLTYRKPHGPATQQTLSRWLKDTLRKSGIDMNIFTAYSTRHASTSAALRKGLSYETIRTSAGWSKNSSTFGRFYNRPLLEEDTFLNTVFR
ncbi:uncharacterized protein LOC115889439 [Sitophilus oryzae]|uniref:Uncharacterized protein LOC115889439 n=1 Tax=Sitophilus oryzae TaxID=7048 RepID=A0A6J2YPR7_SITOR|nr:uncharacterized protein LOC115889439 [Sitophilus oryzae]